ncbi:MAG TPA: DUF1850 domain-containing protein [Acidaminococcaceae bacterium]|nr:DUF1850 domain-containing protein [Acidaminococcaceae bacterium]
MFLFNPDRTPVSTGTRSFLRRPVSAILVVLFVLLVLLGWYGNQLIIAIIPENGLPARTFYVGKGGEWSYHYTHSVQLTPCDEYFRINGPDDMVMTHTVYQSFGVGLPYDPKDGKFTALEKEGKFEMEMNRPYRSLRFRTAVQARPMIFHGTQVYDLCNLYGQGTLVEVRALKRYQYWLL